jgi:phosphatidate cytidylyltransferase
MTTRSLAAEVPGAGTAPNRWRALGIRMLSAAVGLPVIVAAILLGEPWLTILVGVALAIGAAEFCHGAGIRWLDPMTLIAAAAAVALAVTPHLGGLERDAALVALVMGALAAAVFGRAPQRGAGYWLAVAGAVLYVGWLGHYFVTVHDLPNGRDWLLLGMLATFASDTGAYFTGVAIGRHHMAPAISPKKTWEGFAGGVVACVGATVACYAAGAMEFDAARALLLGAPLAIAAPLGDLAESLLKRGMGVKDASGLVPGHGGFLDRLDSLLFTVPAVYFFAVWLGV